jgi:hypothetical protein
MSVFCSVNNQFMYHLSNTRNADISTSHKISFFLDYFQYQLNGNAWIITGYPENHLTILGKIIGRCNTSRNWRDNTKKVVLFLVSMPELDIKKDYYMRKGENKEILSKIKSELNTKTNLIDVKKIHNLTAKLIKQLNGSEMLEGYCYFDSLINKTIEILTGDDKFDDVKNHIIQLSNWIVAEFIRHEIDLQTVLIRKSTIENRITKNNVNSSLNDILHYKFDRYDFNVFFRLEEVRYFDKINSFMPYGMKIYRPDDLRSMYKIGRINSFLIDQFLTPGCIVSHVKINSCESRKKAIELAYNNISDIISILRISDGSNGGLIRKNSVLVECNNTLTLVNDGSRYLKVFSERKYMDTFLLNNRNISYEDRNKANNDAYKAVIRCINSNQTEDHITAAWQFWEIYFSKTKHPTNVKFLMKTVSKSLARRIKDELDKIQIRLNANYFLNNDCIDNISFTKDYNVILSDFKSSKNYNNISVFLKWLLAENNNPTPSDSILKVEARIYNILLQLYEQRNSIHHTGHYCYLTLENLKLYTLLFLTNWHDLFLTLQKQYKNESIDELIHKLILPSPNDSLT